MKSSTDPDWTCVPMLLLQIAPDSAWPTPDFRQTLILGIRQHDRQALLRVRRAAFSQGTTVQLLGEWACPRSVVLATVTAVFCPKVSPDA